MKPEHLKKYLEVAKRYVMKKKAKKKGKIHVKPRKNLRVR